MLAAGTQSGRVIFMDQLPRYDRSRDYGWNYENAPAPVDVPLVEIPGKWEFCGLPVDSPLGVPAGPLLNGAWCLYYASLGFDVVTYKTVRSRSRECYDLPNLQPVRCLQLHGGEFELPAIEQMEGSWAVSYGMPSKQPERWREDIRRTRDLLPAGKLLNVSVVGSVLPDWTIDDLAADYAQCARWAVESGADTVEANFSCPNVSTCDGQLYQQPQDCQVVVKAIREAIGETPLIAKIGRIMDPGDAGLLLEATHSCLDAMAMTNSIACTVVNDEGSLLFDGERRGICGAATLDASIGQTRMVARIIKDRQLDLQLIGVGGADSLDDVQAYLAAGAHSVHIATAAMVDPGLGIEIRRQWPQL
jgi:dihydroorotate dehydrogenase (NAD+) catalytic subunit